MASDKLPFKCVVVHANGTIGNYETWAWDSRQAMLYFHDVLSEHSEPLQILIYRYDKLQELEALRSRPTE